MRAVNLLPRDEPRHRHKRLAVGVQLAIVSPFVVGALLAAGYLLASSKVNDEQATLKALQEELAVLPPRTSTPEANTQLALQHDQRVAALASALRGRVAWDRILREISSVLPEDVWLTTLTAQSPQAPAVPAPPPATTTESDGETTTTTPAPASTPAPSSTAPLSLAGYTYSQEGVARFLSRLAVIPELQDVKLEKSSQATVVGRVVFQFSIQAGVRPQVSA
jgi:Tfp pilus assembly protein PilN